MNHRIPGPATILSAVSLLIAAPALLEAQQPRPEGAWHLIPPRADSVQERPTPGPTREPPEMVPAGRVPGGGPPGATGPGGPGNDMPGGGGPGGSRYRRSPSAKEIERMRQTIVLGHRAPARVRIDPRARTFTTVDSAGVEESWRIGKTVEVAPEDSVLGTVETSVRWKGDALVVERRVDGGGKVRESYGVGLDATRMVVFVEISAGPFPTSFRRQYQKEE